MQRITISLDAALAEKVDRMLAERRYQSRSEGVRDFIREAVRAWEQDGGGAEAVAHTHGVADLSYVYDRETRALAVRLSDMQHAHHDLVISVHAVRLDHRYSMESVLLRGPVGAVRAFAEQVRAERGVRFGTLNLIGVHPNDEHRHSHDHAHDGHAHLEPPPG